MNCLWRDQCDEKDSPGCNGYTPIDNEEANVAFYKSILAENVAEYRLVIAEYGDGNWEDHNGRLH